ncbi:thiamine pyrophosphate-dependent enzyme [Cloacibacillus evryensis]|uniref:thiamine pyrophosphate-dependent enzyme n=1 Tax=Cloacibacillus evryensis TaxID=508460 RepID=UPI0004471205|nr:thiamine pyrophosphate-dependent enzyme [Cloacibacillus evryensis]EXG78541.1 2-oxoacid:ferredoxin oxidoreductase, beta subunit [Cloacibacillus evryensis DSM 19522]MEA5036236.1 thiamine pyrophosphate-dependent enzyme [Cloacibacillus evryensis]
MTEKIIYKRPKSWVKGVHTHYCPGCTHGIVHRMICEVLDELDIQQETVGVAPVGCAALMYGYIDTDFIEAPHGRAPAIATGFKRIRPDRVIFTYQGDGDLASIGAAEIVHAANRSENITVIFINNAIYGMTGGQMAPTTLIGQRTTTTQDGRDPQKAGYPMRISEMLSTLASPMYVERVCAARHAYLPALKRAIRKSFQNQLDNKGFSFVEVLSTCPTNWGLRPKEACDWLVENMIPYYPLGVKRDFE